MKAWAIALVALIAGAAAVTGAILIPGDVSRRDGQTVTNVDGKGPAFTVIGGDDQPDSAGTPTAPGSGSPSGSTGASSRPSAGSNVPQRDDGGSAVDVTNGEFAESSDGQDELDAELEEEEEEAERKAEEEADEQRCEEKKEKDPDADC